MAIQALLHRFLATWTDLSERGATSRTDPQHQDFSHWQLKILKN
jgi:hypothetical protein